MHRFKLKLYYFCLMLLTATTTIAEGNFEDAELVNEFITMSFSSSHPFDLRHTIPGEPEIDYPIYSAVPKTTFDCNGRHEGYYADTETRCQVFRICTNTDRIGRGFAFLCPNGTLFSQKNFVCDWYRNVDCGDSERYYAKNDGNRIGSKNEIMETVRQMMEHPMKTISIALNRNKPVTPQPITFRNSGLTTTKASSLFQTTPAPVRNFPSQQFTRRQPVTLNQVETAGRNSLPNKQQSEDNLSSERTEPIQGPFPTIAPPTHTFLSVTPSPRPATLNNRSPVQQTPFKPNPTSGSTPAKSVPVDKDGVYVSSLGELSTDPGANFNRNTARIIAEPSTSSVDLQISSESGKVNVNKLNFAAKVNAGLKGQRVGSKNEIIAPEYVQNIVHQNVELPDGDLQPPSFNFASNINSLLDEVAFDKELEGQTSMQVQLQTPSATPNGSTKKPFRFLSRGFSYNTKSDGSYVYGAPVPSKKNTLPALQLSTSTQSYSNSLFTTPLFTTPAPVLSTEPVHISPFENGLESIAKPQIISNPKQELIPLLSSRSSNELIQRENIVKLDNQSQLASVDVEQTVSNSPSDLELTFEKSETKIEPSSLTNFNREQREEKLKARGSANEIPQENENKDKANVNKRAEKLLIAGFKQTYLDTFSETKDYEESTSPIIPLYIRVTEPATTFPATDPTSTESTPSTTTSTTPATTATTSSTAITYLTNASSTSTTTTTASSTDATSLAASSTVDLSATPSTTTSTIKIYTSTTTTPPTSSTQSIRRYTVGSARRKPILKPSIYTRRQNSVGLPPRITTEMNSTTTNSPVVNLATSFPTSTTRPTKSGRQRQSVRRYSSGTQRRRSTSNYTTTTTVAPNKKLAVRSSDKDIADLTAVASTYNAAPRRDYNSVRQGSYKYTQTNRRRLNNWANNNQTTAKPTKLTTTSSTTTTSTTTTTQQPRASSSLPTPTLAPFSLSSTSTTPKTPDSLPATYLSFNDLTKAIIDDSILQTFKRIQGQDTTGSQLRSPTVRNHQVQAPIRQQQSAFGATASRIQIQRTTVQPPTRGPQVPLKEFIINKFGAQYSPAPQSSPTLRPIVRPTIPTNIQQNKPSYVPQYPPQQYDVPQDYVPRNRNTSPAARVNAVQQQPQYAIQQQQQYTVQQQQVPQQQQYNQYRQVVPAQQQQYGQYQQQGRPATQPIQNSAYRYPAQQQVQQRSAIQQQSQGANIQQGQQILQRSITSVQQRQQYQQPQPLSQTYGQQQQYPRNQQVQLQQQQLLPNQQSQSSQIEIFPSQMTAAQTIPPLHAVSEAASINVRLPTNLSGLIPSSNFIDPKPSSQSQSRAQKRIDQLPSGESASGESNSFFTGVSSYDVPQSSIGRLPNDITDLLRRIRRRSD